MLFSYPSTSFLKFTILLNGCLARWNFHQFPRVRSGDRELLNAFITQFLGRNFVVIYTDILELAYRNGKPALGFVIAHELAHIKRKHLTWRWLIYPSLFVPFLGTAYLRACEYTCDSTAAHYQPNGVTDGFLELAAGKHLYTKVNIKELQAQAQYDKGFWTWFAEIFLRIHI